MTGPEREARIPLARFREYEAAGGKRYMKAWIGDTVWLLFPSKDEPDFGAVAVWDCVISPKRPRQEQGTSTAASSPDRRRRPPSRATNFHAPVDRSAPAGAPLDDDDLPF